MFDSKIKTLFAGIFAYHFCYALLLGFGEPDGGSFVTPVYLLGLLFLFYKTIVVFQSSGAAFTVPVVICTLCMHLGVLAGVWMSGVDAMILWVPDSLAIHSPGAERIAAWLGGVPLNQSSYYDRVYLAHMVSGLLFFFFGKSPLVSAIALMLARMVTVPLIYLSARFWFQPSTGRLAALLYLFLPTAFFYSLVFYKEAFVHLLVAVVIYSSSGLIKTWKLRSWPYALMLIIGLVFLANERHYLAPCYAVALLTFALASRKVHWVLKVLGVVAAYGGYLAFTHYYRDLNWQSLVKTLVAYREIFLSYPDVNPINRWLPYPLAFIKLLFTPFFTFSKLKTYHHFASLLTWGSFIYQVVVCAFLWGSVLALRNRDTRLWVATQWSSFLVFLSVFAYVAPYSGRMRDSFLPLIAILAAHGFQNSFLRKSLNP